MKAPTEKQIALVENMTHILGIDFPASSKEFTKRAYCRWIQAHMDDYREAIEYAICDEDYCFDMSINDAWCEYY